MKFLHKLQRALVMVKPKIGEISLSELNILLLLERDGPLSLVAIQSSLELSAPSCSRYIRNLEGGGLFSKKEPLVSKREDPKNGSRKLVSLTNKGFSVLQDIAAYAERDTAKIWSVASTYSDISNSSNAEIGFSSFKFPPVSADSQNLEFLEFVNKSATYNLSSFKRMHVERVVKSYLYECGYPLMVPNPMVRFNGESGVCDMFAYPDEQDGGFYITFISYPKGSNLIPKGEPAEVVIAGKTVFVSKNRGKGKAMIIASPTRLAPITPHSFHDDESFLAIPFYLI